MTSTGEEAAGGEGLEDGTVSGMVAVVTGGASGIGEATARQFVAEGGSVIVADIQDEPGEKLVADLGDAAMFVRCDVTEEADIAAAVDAAVGRWGRLDLMFNNAGFLGVIGSIEHTTAEAWDATISVLLRAVFLGMKHAARVMIPQGSGSIVSTSSTAGVVGGLGPHAYTTAKHGVIGMTRSVANELAPHGIRVNAISPGSTVTPLIASVTVGDHTAIDKAEDLLDTGNPLGQATLAADIANAVLYLASDAGRSVSAHTLVVDSAATAGLGMRVSPFHRSDPALHRQADIIERD